MRNLVIGVIVLALLTLNKSAEAQSVCRCGIGPRPCQSYNYAPWQSPRMPCWTSGASCCNSCEPDVYEQCYEQTRAVETTMEPLEVELQIKSFRHDVNDLQKKIYRLEEKAKIIKP
jgi:hypothetical protein